jgi:Kelch motif
VVNGLGPNAWPHAWPNGFYHHTMTVVGSKLFVFGGYSGWNIFNDMWTLDLNSRMFAYYYSKPF